MRHVVGVLGFVCVLGFGCSDSPSKDADPTDTGADVGDVIDMGSGPDAPVDAMPLGPNPCIVDSDCPNDPDVTFANPDAASCAQRSEALGGNYCTECVNDSQCPQGFACRMSTFCERLNACTEGADCAVAGSVVHMACIAGSCDLCLGDADCDPGEVCYDRVCAERSAVDESCLDLSCEGVCEIILDESTGAATGIECLE